MSEEDKNLSPAMVILSMVNGMIGGLILILPVMAITSGYLLAIIIIGITGYFSYFSCRLCISHIKSQPDLDMAILHHFNNNTKIKAFYDLCVWSSLILIDFLYFELITLQWHGLIGESTNKTLNAIFNAVALIGIVFIMKYYEFGASLMAYGIISIIAYLFFLTWAVVDEDKSGVPERPFVAFGEGGEDLAAAMGQAFAIQSFFIPVLKQNNQPKNYGKYVLIAYVLGSLGYFFIAFMGSYSILYRPFLEGEGAQKTIQGYFGYGNWEVHIIQVIYLIHLYSVFPQFLLISKKRLFGVIKLPETQTRHINIQQIIYVCIAVATCLSIRILNVPLKDIIDFNGAVVGFFFIYFIPAALHVKCMYYSKGKIPIQHGQKPQGQDAGKYEEMIEEGDKEINLDQPNNSIESDKKSSPTENTPKIDIEMKQMDVAGQSREEIEAEFNCSLNDNGRFECDCDKKSYTLRGKILNLVLMGVMVGIGLFILFEGLIELGEEATGNA